LIVLPGAADAIRLLAPKHYVIVVTNQSAVGRGYLSEEDLLGIHTELLNRLFRNSARVDGLIYCPHHPTLAQGSYKLDCDCRKPKAGMLRQAAAQWDLDLSGSFFVGDRESDIEAAITAGVKSFLVGDSPYLSDTPTTRVSDLLQAANIILDQDHG
jgi:D-glycero-D-manno-heptose 1,7-bisphosphate phosphatase